MAVLPKCLLVVLLCSLEIKANFPTILPSETIEVYNRSEIKKLIFKTDILNHETEQEIQLKNIKNIIAGVQNIDTTSLNLLINNIMKLLKNIVTQIGSLRAPKLVSEFSAIPKENEVKFPSVTKMLQFYFDLSSTIALLHEKNEKYKLSHQINKRNLAFETKNFPSIAQRGTLLSNPVGCKLKLKKSRNTVSCLQKYLDQLKDSKMTYIGSDLLKYIIRLLNRPVPLLRTFDVLQIVQKLDLVSEVANLNKRDKNLYNYEITVGSHLIELLNKRLSEGPTDQQIYIYKELNVYDFLSTAGDTETTENELPDNEYPELDPDVGETATDYSEPTTRGPDDQPTSWSSAETPTPSLDPVTVSLETQGNIGNIDEPDTVKNVEDTTNSGNIVDSHVQKPEKNDTNDNDITLNDTTSNSDKPVDVNKMAEDIAKINEQVLININNLNKKIADHEKEAKNNFEKADKFVSLQVKDEAPLVIKNGISNLMDYFLQLQDQLNLLLKIVHSDSIQDLFSSLLSNKTFVTLEKGYNQEEHQIELIYMEFSQPLPMYKFERLTFCGYQSCLKFSVEPFFSENLNYSPYYLEKDCEIVVEKKYSCKNYTEKAMPCLEFDSDCEFSVKPLSPYTNKVYMDKYLFVSTPLDKKISLNQYKILEADTFNIITTSEKMKFTIEDHIYSVTGQDQPFKVVVNSLNSRTTIDRLISAKTKTKWELSHGILNSLFILLTYIIIGILVTIYCVKNNKKRLRHNSPIEKRSDDKRTRRYFKIGQKTLYSDTECVDAVELK